MPRSEADAERRAAEADQFRSEGDAAAEQMGEELTATQACTTAAEADRGAAVAQARADADAREAQEDTARTEAFGGVVGQTG